MASASYDITGYHTGSVASTWADEGSLFWAWNVAQLWGSRRFKSEPVQVKSLVCLAFVCQACFVALPGKSNLTQSAITGPRPEKAALDDLIIEGFLYVIEFMTSNCKEIY